MSTDIMGSGQEDKSLIRYTTLLAQNITSLIHIPDCPFKVNVLRYILVHEADLVHDGGHCDLGHSGCLSQVDLATIA